MIQPNILQRSYAYVLEHGIDVANADMQNFKHLEENITAASAGAQRLSPQIKKARRELE